MATKTNEAEPLIPLSRVPQLRRISPATKWRLGLSGKIACTRVNRRLFTTESAVQQFLEAGRVIPAQPPAPAPKSPRRAAQKAEATRAVRERLGVKSATTI